MILILYFALLLVSALSNNQYYDLSGVFYIFLLSFFCFYFYRNSFLLKINLTLFLIISFLLFSLLSAFVNSDIRMLFSSILYTIFFMIFFYTKGLDVTQFDKLMKIFCVSLALLLLIPYLTIAPPTFRSYTGIFYNSNTLGAIAATLSLISLAYIWGKNSYNTIFYLFTFFIGFFFLLQSNSRGSLLAVLFASIVVIISVIYSILLNRCSRSEFICFLILFFLFLACIFIYFVTEEDFFSIKSLSIIDKIVRKSASGDISDQRGSIWLTTLIESTIVGHGSNYFQEHFNLGAHNTFISVLGRYGIISGFLFAFLNIQIFIRCVADIFFVKTRYSTRYISAVIASGFFILANVELMFMTPLFLMFYISVRRERYAG